MRSWTVGTVTVTQIVEQVIPTGIPGLLPDATPEALLAIPWLCPEFVTERGEPTMSLHALVLDTPTKRVLVDTCIGNDKHLPIAPIWDRMQTDFLDKIAAAGFTRESVDMVICTHLHLDHVGWNTMKVGGQWISAFPRARYLFGRIEYNHLMAVSEDPDTDPTWRDCNATVLAESVRPVIDAGLVDLVEMDHRITAEVRLTPTIGHTPGHVAIVIESDGDSAIITGDAVHHPCQLAYPEWGTNIDVDPAQSSRTRWAMFRDTASTNRLMLGTHWPGAGAGTIVRDGDVFRLVFKPTVRT